MSATRSGPPPVAELVSAAAAAAAAGRHRVAADVELQCFYRLMILTSFDVCELLSLSKWLNVVELVSVLDPWRDKL